MMQIKTNVMGLELSLAYYLLPPFSITGANHFAKRGKDILTLAAISAHTLAPDFMQI